MLLTVCILSVYDRVAHLSKILNQLAQQPKEYLDTTEIVVDMDNRIETKGGKRNYLVQNAKGKYVVFIDDDDEITKDYLHELYIGINQDLDAIGITGMYAPKMGKQKPFKCSKNYKWEDKADAYYRPIQHICCIRTSIARQATYPLINFGEDFAYAQQVNSLIHTEYASDKVIYYYIYIHNKK